MEKETAKIIENLNKKIDCVIDAQYLMIGILDALIGELSRCVVMSSPIIYRERIEEVCKELIKTVNIEVIPKGEEADE